MAEPQYIEGYLEVDSLRVFVSGLHYTELIEYRLKQSMSGIITGRSLTGRTSRDKSIIDVLIFGNGHVLHHPLTKQMNLKSLDVVNYDLKFATRKLYVFYDFSSEVTSNHFKPSSGFVVTLTENPIRVNTSSKKLYPPICSFVSIRDIFVPMGKDWDIREDKS